MKEIKQFIRSNIRYKQVEMNISGRVYDKIKEVADLIGYDVDGMIEEVLDECLENFYEEEIKDAKWFENKVSMVESFYDDERREQAELVKELRQERKLER